MKEFTEKILQTLRSNGFPAKRVSLPTDKMFEVADSKGLNFNDVLRSLKEDFGVDSKMGADKIVFSQATNEQMMKEAQEMMAKMNPEELRKIQEMFMNLSQEEKEEIMKKGKDLGLL